MPLKRLTAVGLLFVAHLFQPAQAESPVMVLQWDNTSIKANKIEASGLLWDAQAGNYLLVSDATYEKKPGVFVVEKDGQFRAVLSMQDGTQINDLESISTDGEYIYILNSFSDKRASTGKLIRFKYAYDHVIEQQEINLLDLIKNITLEQPHSDLAKLLNGPLKDQTVDIESHLVINNVLYLGFKAPREINGDTVFVKLDNLAGIFAGEPASAEIILSVLMLTPDTGNPTHLSDMTLVGNELYFLTTLAGNSSDSYLWRYKLGKTKAKLIKTFNKIKAEGITYNPEVSAFVVVFDEGADKPSKFQVLNLSEL